MQEEEALKRWASCGAEALGYDLVHCPLLFFFSSNNLLNISGIFVQDFSSSECKGDKYPPPKYRQGEYSGKVGYFRATQAKIVFDLLF